MREMHATESMSSESAVYECIACKAHWTYAEICNIARCPTCDGGLIRIEAVSSTDPGARVGQGRT